MTQSSKLGIGRAVGLHRACACWIVLLLLGGCVHNAPVPSTSRSTTDIQAPDGSIMIVIDDPRSERRRRGIRSPTYSTALAYHDDPALKRAASELTTDHALTLVAQWPLRNLAVHCLVVEAPTTAVLEALNRDPRVRWVQPFNEFSTQGASQVSSVTGPQSMKALWSSVMGQGAGVRIAVIDTAIDQSHPDLSKSSVRQFNFAGSRGRPGEEEHGTAVVGLISAMPRQSEGVTGFAHEADVQVLRACWQAEGTAVGKCNTLTLALALDAAIDLKPEVLNLSLTGQYDKVLEELIAVLLESGTIVIAAYDEHRASAERFPAARAGVVYAYGAANAGAQPHDRDGIVLHGPRHAMSLAPMAGYDLVSGHSIAAPHISALAARLIESQPDASREQILNQLNTWLGTH